MWEANGSRMRPFERQLHGRSGVRTTETVERAVSRFGVRAGLGIDLDATRSEDLTYVACGECGVGAEDQRAYAGHSRARGRSTTEAVGIPRVTELERARRRRSRDGSPSRVRNSQVATREDAMEGRTSVGVGGMSVAAEPSWTSASAPTARRTPSRRRPITASASAVPRSIPLLRRASCARK